VDDRRIWPSFPKGHYPHPDWRESSNDFRSVALSPAH
jgi:hypothetical protein